jgi:hypothetical protein
VFLDKPLIPSLTMVSRILGVVFYSLALFSGISTAAPNVDSLEERRVCRVDNVLRALQDPNRAAVATSFCQEYIHVPTSTGTITFTPILAGVTLTTATRIATITKTEAVTDIYTVTLSVTKTVTVTKTVKAPRAIAPATDIVVPPFLTQYPARRLSSACSCLSVPPPSTVVTVTGPPLIDWQTSTLYTTVSKPTTVTIKTSVPTYVKITSTVTVTVTATAPY